MGKRFWLNIRNNFLVVSGVWPGKGLHPEEVSSLAMRWKALDQHLEDVRSPCPCEGPQGPVRSLPALTCPFHRRAVEASFYPLRWPLSREPARNALLVKPPGFETAPSLGPCCKVQALWLPPHCPALSLSPSNLFSHQQGEVFKA